MAPCASTLTCRLQSLAHQANNFEGTHLLCFARLCVKCVVKGLSNPKCHLNLFAKLAPLTKEHAYHIENYDAQSYVA